MLFQKTKENSMYLQYKSTLLALGQNQRRFLSFFKHLEGTFFYLNSKFIPILLNSRKQLY